MKRRENLIEARLKLCLTPEQASELIGVSRVTLYTIEVGNPCTTSRSRTTLKRLADAYHKLAIERGLDGDEFLPHLTCPGEFAATAEYVQRERASRSSAGQPVETVEQ